MEKLRKLLNKKGVTLVEMIAALLVFSIILVAITTVFAPLLRTQLIANEFAEANTLMDNLAGLMMYEIRNATEIEPLSGIMGDPAADSQVGGLGFPAVASLTVGTPLHVIFQINPDGILLWHDHGSTPSPVLDRGFYGNKSLSAAWEVTTDGLVRLTLQLRTNEWLTERTYTARPLALSLSN